MDGERQRFFVYFSDKVNITYLLEVSAPKELSFDGVWQIVARGVKDLVECKCLSDEELGIMRKAVDHAESITLRNSSEKTQEIITSTKPAASKEQAAISSDNGESNSVGETGPGFTEIGDQPKKESKSKKAWKPDRSLEEFGGPLHMEWDIEDGVTLRVCNSFLKLIVAQITRSADIPKGCQE